MRFQKIYLEITDVCNLNCSFCPKTGRSPVFISEADFLAILEKIKGYTEYVYFHVMGEPLLHPLLPHFLALAGERGFRVILTTNGTLLSQREECLLSASSLHKVNISLHSMEANQGAEQENYIEKCLLFAQRAEKAGIIVSLRLWNLDGEETKGQNSRNREIIEQIKTAFPEPWKENNRGIKLSSRVFLNYGEKFDWPDLEEKDRGDTCRCYGLNDQLGVLSDGTVVPCCLDHEGDIPLGNLLFDSMEKILMSERTKAIMAGFQNRKAVEELCRRCGYARRFQ